MIHDRFKRTLKDLRISLIDKCNFRCGYCMPNTQKYHFLSKQERLSIEEITRLTRIFSDLGVEKIRLTGGEPLLRKDIASITKAVKNTPGIKEVALTTNGYLLKKYAKDLKSAGLDRVTISLDSIDAKLFRYMSGVNATITPVLEGIEAAIEAGFSGIKVNMVVQKGLNTHQIIEACRYFRQKPVQMRFIEFMDVGNSNDWCLDKVLDANAILERISSVFPLIPEKRSTPSAVATTYRYADGQGSVGIIASISKPFCKDCVRMRLSADGKLYTCLFATAGKDIRPLLKEDDHALQEAICKLWSKRGDRYSLERSSHTPSTKLQGAKIEMFRMGG